MDGSQRQCAIHEGLHRLRMAAIHLRREDPIVAQVIERNRDFFYYQCWRGPPGPLVIESDDFLRFVDAVEGR